MITLAVTIRCKLDQVQAARLFFQSFVPRAQKEPGCRLYILAEGDLEAGVFHFYEQWVDQASLDLHNQQSYLKEFHARFSELLAAPNQVLRLKNVT